MHASRCPRCKHLSQLPEYRAPLNLQILLPFLFVFLMPITNWVPKLVQQLNSLDNRNIVPSVEKGFDQTSTNLTVFTYEEGVCFSHGHDAHDGGDAAPKGNEALQGVASNVPEGASRPAMQGGGTPPSQAGQVQSVHIIQKVALQKLQQTRVVVYFPF